MKSYNRSSKTSSIPQPVIEAWFAGQTVSPLRGKGNPARPDEIIPRRQPTFAELFEWQDRYQPAAWAVIRHRMGIPFVSVYKVARNGSELSEAVAPAFRRDRGRL